MAEWSIAAVLKTVEGQTSGGSNPSLSATKPDYQAFVVYTPNFTHTNGENHLIRTQPICLSHYGLRGDFIDAGDSLSVRLVLRLMVWHLRSVQVQCH